MTKSKITVFPNGDIVEIDSETTILQALLDRGLYVKSNCGGHASCSDCIIKIKEGEDNITPAPFEEVQLLGNVFHITKERLSCQTRVTGDITIDLSAHDKSKDEAKSKSKSSNFKKGMRSKVRKKEEVTLIKDERKQKREEKKADDDTWVKHWEKESGDDKPVKKRLGGGKRPRPFTYERTEGSDMNPNTSASTDAEKNREAVEGKKDFRKERAKKED